MTHKYRFSITYENQNCKDFNNLMKCMGVSFGDFFVKETFELSTTKNESVEKIKNKLTEGFLRLGCVIVGIEGEKIE
jgi:hypothetical protein